MKISVMSVLVLLSVNVANSADMKKTEADPLTTEVTATSFKAHLQPGFHFNEKAPNLLRLDQAQIQPKSLAKTEIEFAWPAEKKFESARVSLYICDDALTFCKMRWVQFGKGKVFESKSKPSAAKLKINRHGFIEDNLEYAFQQAKKQKKLVLVDFSARWCPGCVRLETDIFGTPQFKEAAKNFVKVRLDFDRFENAFLKDKWDIQGIPTLIAMTADEQEISRIVDYQPAGTISTFLASSVENPEPYEALKKKVESKDMKSVEMLAQRLYDAGRYQESIEYFQKIKPEPVQIAGARVLAMEGKFRKDPIQKQAFVDVLNIAIQEEPRSTRSIGWRASLIPLLEAKSEERQKVYDAGMAVANDLLQDNSKMMAAFRGDFIGEYSGYEKLLLATERSDLVDAMALSEVVQQEAYKKVADVGKELKISLKAVGPSMRHLIYLTLAKDYTDAEALAKSLLKADPTNAELQRRLIVILNKEKKYAEAAQMGLNCLQKSYGTNEITVAEQFAEALIGTGKKDEAKKLINTYLGREEIYWANMAGHKKKFEELQKSIGS